MPIALRMLNKIEGLQQLVISLFKSLQVRPGLDLFCFVAPNGAHKKSFPRGELFPVRRGPCGI